MTKYGKSTVIGTAASLLLACGTAQAEGPGPVLTEEEVQHFFDQMEQDVTKAVQAGDFRRLIEWTQDTIAEEATFSISNEVYRGDERKSFTVALLDKEDITRLGRAAAGMLSAMQGQPVRGYSLEAQVTGFTLIAPDVANVTTEFAETGTLSMPGLRMTRADPDVEILETGTGRQQAETGSAPVQETDGRSMRIEATAECEHIVRREPAGYRLVIGLSTCQARTDLQPAGG